MNNKHNMQYIRISNFNEGANKLINKAIYFASDEKCAEVSTVHLFLAAIDKTEFGENILEYLDTTFDMVYESYKMLAELGEYGTVDKTQEINYDPNTFSRDLFALLGTITYISSMTMHPVTPDTIVKELLSGESNELGAFLDYIGTSYDELNMMQGTSFYIPEQLLDFVVDMNSETQKNEECISNIDKYTDEMINVLSRKLEANPCLVGEAGVGKTTIVRGLVQRIISGDVPDNLKETHIVYINSSLLISGTKFRGQFEQRMKDLIDWASESDVILFLDEMHTFINLGSGSGDDANTAGNMIKKALSDGDIRVIGATTNKEYHKFIEKDSAFSRRLQVINIREPKVNEAIDMVKKSIKNYEDFHNVKVPNKCVELSVKLSDSYIKDRSLPAKAYSVIDQSCTITKLDKRNTVTEDDVFKTISNITGININRISKSEAKQLLTLEDTISKNVIGQENAIKTVCRAIRRSKAGVRDKDKPLASFLFVGPTGVGKTELCKVLSKEVAIGDTPLIKVDMSEYSEKSSISKLIGSAPGYVGYGEGGQLTEKVKHNPYSIVLFDEIEKAHPEIFNAFLQLLDEGKMTDGEGNTTDFTNCIIVMTSNAGYGASEMNKSQLGFSTTSDNKTNPKEQERIAMKALESTFKPEFINRLDNIVIFDKLSKDQCKDVTKLLLNKVSNRLLDQEIKLKFDKSVVEKIVSDGYSDKYGARNIRREIQDSVEDTIADAVLDGSLYKGCNATLKYSRGKLKFEVL